MAHYEQMANQFGDSKRAVNYLPKNMRPHLGQLPEDLGGKIATVTSAIAAGAAKLENPKPPEASKSAVSVDIPYVPVVAGVIVVIGAFYLLKKKK